MAIGVSCSIFLLQPHKIEHNESFFSMLQAAIKSLKVSLLICDLESFFLPACDFLKRSLWRKIMRRKENLYDVTCSLCVVFKFIEVIDGDIHHILPSDLTSRG